MWVLEINLVSLQECFQLLISLNCLSPNLSFIPLANVSIFLSPQLLLVTIILLFSGLVNFSFHVRENKYVIYFFVPGFFDLTLWPSGSFTLYFHKWWIFFFSGWTLSIMCLYPVFYLAYVYQWTLGYYKSCCKEHVNIDSFQHIDFVYFVYTDSIEITRS